MCGICGYYCFGEERPEKKFVENMWLDIESRGRDATGFAFIENRQLRIGKAPLPAEKFIKLSKLWNEIQKFPKMMILHTRASTGGSPKNNKNNHPLYSKEGLGLVHNGMLYNDDEIFKNRKRDGEVDSEALLAVLNNAKNWRTGIRNLNRKIIGWFAIAAIHARRPDEMLLATNTGNLVLAWDERKKILYFASEASAFEGIETEHLGLVFEQGGLPVHEVTEDVAYLVDKNGITLLRKLKQKEYSHVCHYQPGLYGGYNWEEGRRTVSYLPESNPKDTLTPLELKDHYNLDGDELFCPTCSYRKDMPNHQADPGYCPECNSIMEIV